MHNCHLPFQLPGSEHVNTKVSNTFCLLPIRLHIDNLRSQRMLRRYFFEAGFKGCFDGVYIGEKGRWQAGVRRGCIGGEDEGELVEALAVDADGVEGEGLLDGEYVGGGRIKSVGGEVPWKGGERDGRGEGGGVAGFGAVWHDYGGIEAGGLGFKGCVD